MFIDRDSFTQSPCATCADAAMPDVPPVWIARVDRSPDSIGWAGLPHDPALCIHPPPFGTASSDTPAASHRRAIAPAASSGRSAGIPCGIGAARAPVPAPFGCGGPFSCGGRAVEAWSAGADGCARLVGEPRVGTDGPAEGMMPSRARRPPVRAGLDGPSSRRPLANRESAARWPICAARSCARHGAR